MVHDRSVAKGLASEYLNRGDPLGWFDKLYAKANQDHWIIPWAELTVNPNLASWVEAANICGTGTPALVVGCGLGDDAEYLAKKNFEVTAFDISPKAIDWCRSRFPDSKVCYGVNDLFDSPSHWAGRFNFVFESYTLQALPIEYRKKGIKIIANLVAPGGILLFVSHSRDVQDAVDEMPWPLTHQEIDLFRDFGLREVSFKDYTDTEDPPIRRFVAAYKNEKNV